MSTWNGAYEGVPDGGDSPSTLDNTIRDLKTSIEGRIENEHDTYVVDGTAGAESKDWRHKEGSARAYYQSAEPTNQPGSNGAALGADDEGRIWVDSDTKEIRIWNGTTFVPQGFLNATNIITTANFLEEVSTQNDIFDKLDSFIPTTGSYMAMFGTFTMDGSFSIINKAKRTSATVITLYGGGPSGTLMARALTNGDSTATTAALVW